MLGLKLIGMDRKTAFNRVVHKLIGQKMGLFTFPSPVVKRSHSNTVIILIEAVEQNSISSPIDNVLNHVLGHFIVFAYIKIFEKLFSNIFIKMIKI